MSDVEYTIPRGSKILVTGANGFIGSNIVDQLLSLGFIVRGTVRDTKSWLNDLFDKKYGKGRFETCIVSDITSQVQWKKASNGVAGIIHAVRLRLVKSIYMLENLTCYRPLIYR